MGTESRKYIAEMIGTFVLVFGGIGTAVIAGEAVGALGVSIAFGLSLLAMVYAIGPISGCHINPAVTLGLLLTGKIGSRSAAGYVVAQVIGAIVAAGVLLLVARDLPGGYDAGAMGLGANGYDDHSPNGYGLLAALIVEVVLTAFLVLTVLGATHRAAPVGFAGIPIGLVLTLIHLVSIPVTNTSVNPARSIGPAVYVGDWALSQLWVFIIAPLAGAVLAVALYRLTHPSDDELTAAEAERALPEERRQRG
ncbi:MAG TPA: aquaporin Z [Thermomicrobiales bacterium]|jgi:aquaporin Z|nr:aquaporin Z [Thermomicrobiales bacterium]